MNATYLLVNTAYIVGTFDVAELAILLFILFFIGLVFYLNRESRREGYPVEHEQTGMIMSGPALTDGEKKTFNLPHGRGTYIPEDNPRDDVNIAAKHKPALIGLAHIKMACPEGDNARES